MERCYYCGVELQKNEREHVPPLCLFPKFKDAGRDLRSNLITLPSCPDHNSKKSKDDEYLKFILTAYIGANDLARNACFESVARSIERSPYLLRSFVMNPQPIIVTHEGEVQQTITYELDDTRINTVVDHIAHGLYFHEYGEAFTGRVILLFNNGLTFLADEDQEYWKIKTLLERIAEPVPFNGKNQEVFRYKLVSDSDFERHFLIMNFYEAVTFIAALSKNMN